MALKIISSNKSRIPDDNQSEEKPFKDGSLKITKISQQIKRQDRYSIYVNEKYSFSLNEYQLVNSGLKIGREVTQEELVDFATESQFGKAYERSLNYVMIRPRSEKEITDYLTRTFLYPRPKSYVNKDGQRQIIPQVVDKENTKQMIGRVMERLNEKGYINDEAFAKSWVASRQLNKKSSKRKLQQELQVKGISSEIIATVLQNESIDEVSNLNELIAKKRRLSKYKDEVKLMQYLARQGFRYDDIKEALRENEL